LYDETLLIRHNDEARMLAVASLLRLDTPGAAELLTPNEIVWPACWRQAVHAVELCQRAAEFAARR
jgi:hypothetical protein